ncbi:MAG: hypothetical protein LBH06_05560, partial [Rikenellaceae bacterium]|nr:hypothetical protein [Rikenellaceae bacterium]
SLNATIANTISLRGKLALHRDDPVYGEGFFGELHVGIGLSDDSIKVDMRGCFGRVDGYRYWFVDGGVVLAQGIPIVGPFRLKGLYGAVSHRMVGAGKSSGNASAFASGSYTPDKNMGLGLKSSVMFDTGAAMNGEACFDIAFTSSGGLHHIGFYGYAEFAGKTIKIPGAQEMKEKYAALLKKEETYTSGDSRAIDKLKQLKQIDPNKAAEAIASIPTEIKIGIMGTMGITYDFTNRSLHATAEVFVNSPGGVLTGDGQGGRAGNFVLHIDANDWYLHMGKPDDRIGLRFNLGNILNVRTGAYLMAGSGIPAMPAPPRQVADILGRDLSELTLGRNIDALSTGKGFAFGADLAVSTGDISFLIMYANFAAGLGFDIMLKDYGQMQCAETGRQIGMNGWYAMGQAYAYLQGELGVNINLWFLKTKVPVIKGAAAALLQASLPNPSSFNGYLGVNVNVLGLVKGNMRFKLHVGDECTPVIPGGSPLQMAMISDLAPGDGDSEISVFTAPQATFTSSLEQPFEAEDDAGVQTYRVRLKSFAVTDEGGVTVNGALKWNEDKNAVTFRPKEILPPNTQLVAKVEVCFDKFSGGQWNAVYTSGKEAIETKECSFTTGGAPDNIPLENVEYSYPVIDQQYYLAGESTKGFAKLKFGQKYLFEQGFDYKLQFRGDDNRAYDSEFRYNEAEGRLEYTIPELEQSRKYTLSIAYTPKDTQPAATGSATSQKLFDNEQEGTLSVEGRAAEAAVERSIEKSILDYGFASSRYRTFAQKIASFNTDMAIAQDASYSFRFMYDVRSADEPFDMAEIAGVEKTEGKPLIRPEAELKEPFFTETVNPLVYSGYPFGGVRLDWRNDSEMGVPPVRSVSIYGPYLDLIEGEARPKNFYFPLAYEAGIIAERDFRNLQSLVINNYARGLNGFSKTIYDRFSSGSLPFIRKGFYKTVLRYTLPDGTTTSSCDFMFNNFLKFNE